jgi:hypothetical protein
VTDKQVQLEKYRKDKLVADLKKCANEDTESGHMHADVLLLEYINDPDVTAAWRALDKWFA